MKRAAKEAPSRSRVEFGLAVSGSVYFLTHSLTNDSEQIDSK